MQYSHFKLSAIEAESSFVGRIRCVGERELEVATITYTRVSGLEGLGSPIISGVGSD